MKIDFRQIVNALSDTLDLVGVNDYQHCKRVAFMSYECMKRYGWSEADLDDIYHAGLLHDCGVSTTREHTSLVSELDWQGSNNHCTRGYALLKEQPYFSHLAEAVLLHHTHWERLQTLDVDPRTRLMANMIFLADRVDALVAQHPGQDILLIRNEVQESLARHSGDFFAPELVRLLLDVSDSAFFWMTLEARHLNLYLREMAQHLQPREISPADFLQIASLFAQVVDAKSPFTASHSQGVGRLAAFLGQCDGHDQNTCYLLEIAGLLHDLGKLNIPDAILEKAGPLDPGERALMMRHSFESYQILRQIDGLAEVAQWAAFHHETLAGDGYPYGLKDTHLSRQARIVAVADVFQALAQDRPYRGALPKATILGILQDMAHKNKLDQSLVALVEQNLDQCWQHALCQTELKFV